jgi:carbamoyl-phosphate synthase small subunit
VETIRALMGKTPLFGIGLGHQLLALAAGGKTVRLPYGHRGASQPVKDLTGNRTYITAQNHGYAVEAGSLENAFARFVNANDMTCEGLEYPSLRAFSVQFDPEISSGPNNCAFLFDRFFELMGGDCACR